MKKQLCGTITLIALSFNVTAQNKVVVIPLFGDDAPAEPTSRVVFVTQGTHNGDFGGPAGADAFCQAQADLNNTLVGGKVFKAWISGGSGFDISPFTRSEVPYVTTAATVVANNFTDLTSGTLSSGINLDQYGNVVPFNYAMTGLFNNGTETSFDCGGWTDAGGATFPGVVSDAAGQAWSFLSFTSPLSCSTLSHVYCFEQ